MTEPWPCPVAPREPKSSARTRPTRSSSPSSRRPEAKVWAARIGPTVCELEGPMPTENRSKEEMAMSVLSLAPSGAPWGRPGGGVGGSG